MLHYCKNGHVLKTRRRPFFTLPDQVRYRVKNEVFLFLQNDFYLKPGFNKKLK
jgi:hypothetical protein